MAVTPPAVPHVREIGEAKEAAEEAPPMVVPAEPDGTERARRRLQREFVSMDKLRRMQGEDGVGADGAGEGAQARLIIKETGAELSPEPRQLGKPANGAGDSDARSSGEQAVLRLERKQELARRTHDVAVEVISAKPEAGAEEGWEPQRHGMSWRWVVGVVGAMVVLVIAALVGVQVLSVLRSGGGVRSTPIADFEVEKIDLGQAGILLEESPGKLFEMACECLATYCAATTPEEALVVVRHPEQEREAFTRQWQPCVTAPLFDRLELIQYALMATQKPPAMVVWGMREDFSPFRAYFVHEDGRMTLDWRATEGFCDIPIADLPAAGEISGVTVRCILETKVFHTAAFPDDKFRSFLLSGADAEHFVWGYVELDGDLDRRLRDVLNSRVGLLREKQPERKQRVTVVLEAPSVRQLQTQFVISEMLHIEWVTP